MNPAVMLASEVELYPVINPALAIARGSVLSQPGREKKVYFDPMRMKPCACVGSEGEKAKPTMVPPSLMPCAETL